MVYSHEMIETNITTKVKNPEKQSRSEDSEVKRPPTDEEIESFVRTQTSMRQGGVGWPIESEIDWLHDHEKQVTVIKPKSGSEANFSKLEFHWLTEEDYKKHYDLSVKKLFGLE